MDFGKLLGAVGNAVSGNWGDAIKNTLEGVGITKDTSQEDIEKILKNRADIQIALLNAQTEQMKAQLDSKTRIIEATKDDNVSARERQIRIIESNHSNWLNRNIVDVLAIMVILVFAITVVLATQKNIATNPNYQIVFSSVKDITFVVLLFYFGGLFTRGDK